MKIRIKAVLNSIVGKTNSLNYKGFHLSGLKFVAVITTLMATFNVNAVPIFYNGTGHYYEVISADAITWNDANAAANAMFFAGVNGHLATLTSMAENDFVNTLRNAVTLGSTFYFDTEFWIGAFQPFGSIEPAGGWTWVNGEGLLSAGFTNWYPGEPNNAAGEEFAALGLLGQDTWNDEIELLGIGGFVVEYSIPVPSTMALLGLGLAGFGLARRKKA